MITASCEEERVRCRTSLRKKEVSCGVGRGHARRLTGELLNGSASSRLREDVQVSGGHTSLSWRCVEDEEEEERLPWWGRG